MCLIKCAVYKNNYEFGGGYWYIPVEVHQEISTVLLDNYYEYITPSEPFGIFDFDTDYLNTCYELKHWNCNEYWDGTWNE